MTDHPLERLRAELSLALNLALDIQDDTIALADAQQDAQVRLALGAHDGQLHLICPVATIPDEASSWVAGDEADPAAIWRPYGVLSRWLLQLNGDTGPHAQHRLALDGSGQLLLMAQLSPSLTGPQVLAHLHDLGLYLGRIRQALQATLHPQALRPQGPDTPRHEVRFHA
jgi:hypothetical protein